MCSARSFSPPCNTSMQLVCADLCSFPSWNNLEWNKKYECFALVLEDSQNSERRQNGSSKKKLGAYQG
jgi:hypothetical protein